MFGAGSPGPIPSSHVPYVDGINFFQHRMVEWDLIPEWFRRLYELLFLGLPFRVARRSSERLRHLFGEWIGWVCGLGWWCSSSVPISDSTKGSLLFSTPVSSFGASLHRECLARGLGNKDTVRALKDFLKKFNPCIDFLCETKKTKTYIEKLRIGNGFSSSFYMNPRGLAGGLALWWTTDNLKFPKAIGTMEATVASDHNPIVLLLDGLKKREKFDFKFESRWLLHEDYSSNIKEAWSVNTPSASRNILPRKWKITKVKLCKWRKTKIPNHCRYFRVSDLIDSPNRRRKLEILGNLFTLNEAKIDSMVTSEQVPNAQDVIVGLPPDHDYVKVNCDGTFDSSSGNAIAAYVIRKSLGQIVGVDTMLFLANSAIVADVGT
ncbi:hypothetical protein V6N11_058559 [Hibiscus sabdariffa]|uniref:Uncharacterized protein n=1 Tax=Hibiscus sabdariffa TaxID=183260 RepID=A0ABR2U4X4_9ROSI